MNSLRLATVPPEQVPDELEPLTPQEVATIFKVPVTWVYQQVRARANSPIPHYKLGKYIRFNESEVRDWFRLQKREYRTRKKR